MNYWALQSASIGKLVSSRKLNSHALFMPKVEFERSKMKNSITYVFIEHFAPFVHFWRATPAWIWDFVALFMWCARIAHIFVYNLLWFVIVMMAITVGLSDCRLSVVGHRPTDCGSEIEIFRNSYTFPSAYLISWQSGQLNEPKPKLNWSENNLIGWRRETNSK